MAKLSLKESLKELVIHNDVKTATKQVVEHLEGLGFECKTNQESSYNDKYGNKRKGKVPIVAKKGKKTVAIDIDNKSPRARTLIKLNNIESDYKLVLLRGGNKDYIERQLKARGETENIKKYIKDETSIHVLSLNVEDKPSKASKTTKRAYDDYVNYNYDNYDYYQKELFNVTYTYLSQSATTRIPTFNYLFSKIKTYHMGLSQIDGAREIVKRALKEYKEVISI